MSKRFADSRQLESAPTLAVSIPPSAHLSDPISLGTRPELYREMDLKKVAVQKHARTDEFEKRLIGIWWLMGEKSVPFIFRTCDGVIRSLDAGCLGFLLNRKDQECSVVTDNDGYVVSVIPNKILIDRYQTIRARLTNEVTPL